MKPKTRLEQDLQAVIDGGGLRPLTAKQMEKGSRFDGKLSHITVTETTRGMKLTKCYKVHAYGRKRNMIMFHLCLIKAERDGHTAWAGRRTGMSWYMDDFSYDGELSIKTPKAWYDDYISIANPVDNRVTKIDPYAVYRTENHNQFVFHDSRIETMANNGDEWLVNYVMASRKPLSDHLWRSYIVAHRHGFKMLTDAFVWVSLVNLLHANGRDTRNPHYICPEDVYSAYQDMVDVNDKRLKRAKEERKKKAAIDFNEAYVKQHKKWLGVVIVSLGITIKPLQSVSEFEEEGKAMKHCVFANEYYRKRNSLILSAKDKRGKRLATIEYDLKNKTVLQCRAEKNKMPEQYDRLCKMVKRYFAA